MARTAFGIITTLVLVWISSCSGTGCSGAENGERAHELQQLIVEDNRIHLEREPELVAGKFRKMAVNPYLYMRGTSNVFWHDSMERGPGSLPTRYGSRAASRVLITGDAHVENFGSYRNSEGEILLDFNDFDTATWGPFHLEVRRLALSWYVAGRMIEEEVEGPENFRYRLAHETIMGYMDEVEAQLAGEEPIRVRRDPDAGRIVLDLFRRAVRDGDIREELDDFSRLEENGSRVMFFGVVKEGEDDGIFGSEIAEISIEERRMVERIVEQYRHTIVDPERFRPEAFRIKGVGRRLGAGVGSYAILRYYVLLEGETDEPDDDWVIDIKEAVDAIDLPGLQQTPRNSGWRHAAERVVQTTRMFHEGTDNDPLVGWARVGDLSFHVQDRTKYQKNLDVERFIDRYVGTERGTFNDENLIYLARLVGRVLARGHLGAPTLDGNRGLDAIGPLLDGERQGFRDETMRFVGIYGPQLYEDFYLFRELLETKGPLLGHSFNGPRR